MIPVEKKSRKRNIAIPTLFPDDKMRLVGYFTGNDVEVFDEESIKTLDKTCYGMNPKPRQMMNHQLSMERVRKSTEADYNRRLVLKEKLSNSFDADEINDPSMTSSPSNETILVGEKVVANPYPISRSIVLFLEEAFFLHNNLKNLEVLDLDDKPMTTEELWQKFCNLKSTFVECFASYLYLKSKFWVIKGGIKFGGDFLLYKLSPHLFHASYIVIVSRKGDTSTQSYQTNERIAETTGKNLLYLDVNISDDIHPSNYLNNFDKMTIKEVCIKRHEMISRSQ